MFEKNLKSLEELVKKMEAQDLSLEEGLKTFQDGIQLVKKCQQALSDAELKVKEVIDGQQLEVHDLTPNETEDKIDSKTEGKH